MNHPYNKIFLFGDSITQMSFDPNNGGFGAGLAHVYQRKADVMNRGFSGYNTDWSLPILQQLLPTVADRDKFQSKIHIMTIFFGANDASLPFSFQHVPLDRFKSNLHTMLDMVKDRSSDFYNPELRVILITPPPLYEPDWKKRCEEDGVPLNRTLESSLIYAEAVRDVGRSRDVVVADIWTRITETARQEQVNLGHFALDGLHLNEKGNKVVYDMLMDLIAQHFPEVHPDQLEMELPSFRDLENKDDDVLSSLKFPLL